MDGSPPTPPPPRGIMLDYYSSENLRPPKPLRLIVLAIAATTRGDQEEMYAMGIRGGQLPQVFNWLRLLPGDQGQAKAIHWTGIAGKAHIRNTMKQWGIDRDHCDPTSTSRPTSAPRPCGCSRTAGPRQ